MSAWDEIYRTVTRHLQEAGRNTLFFRGHSDASWKLLPGVARLPPEHPRILENRLIFEFLTRAGALLRDSTPSWSNVFAMQHHGMPTRLLDWTETFGVALFFALREGKGDAAVWILDPYDLNQLTRAKRTILDVTAFAHSYYDYFISGEQQFDPPVVALSPPSDHPRILHQRGCFTLHKDISTPLEELYGDVVTKVLIPAAARDDARMFLRSVGISEFPSSPTSTA